MPMGLANKFGGYWASATKSLRFESMVYIMVLTPIDSVYCTDYKLLMKSVCALEPAEQGKFKKRSDITY
jgi:hypothetical protein